MKIAVGRSELLAALRKAKAVTGGAGAGKPMLRSVRIASFSRPDGAGIEISATNLEESIRVEVAGEEGAGEGFLGLVGPERLIAFLGADPGKEVDVWVEGEKLIVKGLARATFPLEDATDYPTLPELPAGAKGIEIEEETAAAIRRAARFAEREGKEATEKLRQVCLWEQGGLLSAGASEGHCLWVEHGLAVAEEGFGMVLPLAAAAGIEACRLVAREGMGHIFLAREGEVIAVRQPEVDAGMLKGALPQMRSQGEGEAIDVEGMLAAVRAVAARIAKDEGDRVLLRLREGKGGTVVHAQGVNGEAEAELPDPLPSYATKYVELLVAGLESLVEVKDEDEKVMAQAGSGDGLYFGVGEKAELVLTGWKER